MLILQLEKQGHVNLSSQYVYFHFGEIGNTISD